jgi:hypothetical protein
MRVLNLVDDSHPAASEQAHDAIALPDALRNRIDH